jgi:hypothetical protein
MYIPTNFIYRILLLSIYFDPLEPRIPTAIHVLCGFAIADFTRNPSVHSLGFSRCFQV